MKNISVTNPDKILWPKTGTTKMEYLTYLFAMADYILPYTRERLLTVIRFPDGVEGKSFYQKNAPAYTPEWIKTYSWHQNEYIVCNDKETLLWLGNQAALELHVAFNRVGAENMPTELVFDLDPSTEGFDHVREAALYVREALEKIGLISFVKTSGATGLQVYVPITFTYTYEQTRRVGKFIAEFLVETYPSLLTVERFKGKRGDKLYIDYVQHAPGKTLPPPYSVRARALPTVSAPVTWQEIEKGCRPEDFTIGTIPDRVKTYGDLFAPLTNESNRQPLDAILKILD
ncbi:non-homologous end-joining DNA ligase [Aneurinibacillus terranovensis]|uniref:non-homologous end-joining DNA ligase n=1 Tax=Aneurinibacillus terranovensis TaxID=278991 RepID=UPI00041739BE|nr:non-homologous end-joining DNA ligase [Aneurinibacillus terranovensis]